MSQSAVLSPDGRNLAYSKVRFTANVWRVPLLQDRPATWDDARQITIEEAHVESLDVSPDGKRLLVASNRTGNWEIWMLPAAGGELQQLTDHPRSDNNPTCLGLSRSILPLKRGTCRMIASFARALVSTFDDTFVLQCASYESCKGGRPGAAPEPERLPT